MIFGYKPGNFSPKSGTVVPTTVVPNFIGQIYIDTVKDVAYVSYGLAAGEWLPQSVGLLDYMGAWDASGGTYPIAGSGSGGEVRQGDLWVISVQGTLGGETIHVGDMIIANTDDPEQVAANWDHINGNISYVPEDEANKVTSISSSSTDVEYPSAKLVYDQLLLKMTRITSVDNTLPRFDGTDGSVKSTNILVDDSDNVSAVGTLGCGAITSTGTLALGANSITMSGSIGVDGTRVTKGWFTDLESTNDITINGNALSTLFAPIDIDASDIAVAEIGTATHDNVQDYINNITSSGRVSGGTIVDDADGTITVGAGTGYVKIADSDISETKAFDWAQSTTVSLVDKNINYIYITNATGTPVVSSTITRSSIPTTWAFTLGRVYKDGTTLSIINSGTNLDNHIRDNHERLVNVRYFEHSSGAAIAESGNRYITSTDGVFYIGANRTITTAKDTTGADTITYWYQDSGTGWTTGTESVMNNLNYDDGDGTLGTIGVAKYSARYVYIDFAGNLHYQFGQQSDRLRTTKAETLPTPPNFLAEFATLAAKIIVVKSGTNFTSVQSAFDTALSYNGVYDHNDLSNLQGGAAGERYHTTLAQYTIAIQAATTALDGYLSSTDWNTFNGKSDKLTDQSFTPTAGQTSFVLSTVPTNNAQIFMLVNNAVYVVGNDFTISGVTITWLDHFVMETTDVVTVRYP